MFEPDLACPRDCVTKNYPKQHNIQARENRIKLWHLNAMYASFDFSFLRLEHPCPSVHLTGW